MQYWYTSESLRCRIPTTAVGWYMNEIIQYILDKSGSVPIYVIVEGIWGYQQSEYIWVTCQHWSISCGPMVVWSVWLPLASRPSTFAISALIGSFSWRRLLRLWSIATATIDPIRERALQLSRSFLSIASEERITIGMIRKGLNTPKWEHQVQHRSIEHLRSARSARFIWLVELKASLHAWYSTENVQ